MAIAMTKSDVEEMLLEMLYYVSKINHHKSGKVTFLLHEVKQGAEKDFLKTHPNIRQVTKDVFDKIREQKILPDTLFENLSAAFPDRQFDPTAFPAAICEQLNARFNDK